MIEGTAIEMNKSDDNLTHELAIIQWKGAFWGITLVVVLIAMTIGNSAFHDWSEQETQKAEHAQGWTLVPEHTVPAHWERSRGINRTL